MKYYLLFLIPVAIVILNQYDSSLEKKKKLISHNVSNNILPKKSIKKVKVLSVKEKKKKFEKTLVPIITKVHNELFKQYLQVQKDINNSNNLQEIAKLKKIYKVKTDKELLLALKPHPISIVLAQAAIESGWGTSRFFRKANNVFGIWSFSKNQPRIPAGKTRNGKIIWLKKYPSIEDSVKDYYKNIGRSPFFKNFRKLRFKSNDPYQLITQLNKYSERGGEYEKTIESVIKHNHFKKFDTNISDNQIISTK